MAGVQRYRRPMPNLFDWFEDFPFSPWGRTDEHPIRVEEYAENGEYTVKADLPGIDPDNDVAITVEHGMLTIHAERREEKKEGKRSEFHYGSFTRSIQLPAGVKEEEIKAAYEGGVLTVTVPVGTDEGKAKRIPISKGP